MEAAGWVPSRQEFLTFCQNIEWRWVAMTGTIALFSAAIIRRAMMQEKNQKQSQTVHRGVVCSNCEDVIRGTRYLCANCADYDICEKCEQLDIHYKTHVFLKIKIPIPPLALPPGALIPVLYPGRAIGDVSPKQVKELQEKTHFDKGELEALFEQFKSLSKTKEGIDKETFESCLGPLGVKTNLVTDRIFRFFDQDGNGTIDFSELVCGLSVLCKGTPEEKIEYAFYGYDLDGDGYIDREELYKMFKAYFYLSMEVVRSAVKVIEEEVILNFRDDSTTPVSSAFSGLPVNTEQEVFVKQPEDEPLNNEDLSPVMDSMYQVAIEEIVDKAFAAADSNNDGSISFEEFKAWAIQDPTMIYWLEALGSVF